VTSISAGERWELNVSGVPHRGQKVRVPCSDDRKLAGAPDVKWKLADGMVNHATNGAALVRRQIEQWQLVSCEGIPAAR
jgi:hypothetical protein